MESESIDAEAPGPNQRLNPFTLRCYNVKHRLHKLTWHSKTEEERNRQSSTGNHATLCCCYDLGPGGHLQSERRESPDPEAAGCCSEPGSVAAPLLPGGC